MQEIRKSRKSEKVQNWKKYTIGKSRKFKKVENKKQRKKSQNMNTKNMK